MKSFIFAYDHESFRVFKTSSTLDLVSSMIFVAHLGQQVSPTKNDSIAQGTSQVDATTLFHA